MASFKFSRTFLQMPFCIFNKLCSASQDLLLQIYLNLFFIITHEILYMNLFIHFKKCQNFQTKNKLKELILAKIHEFRIYHMSFNFVWGLKWKSISLLRGFCVTVQCSSSNSKSLWRNSIKKGEHLASKTVPAIPQKMRRSYFMMDFQVLVPISKETKM